MAQVTLMKRSLILGFLAASLAGCVDFPLPHQEWDAPKISGRVVGSDDRLPVGNAMVTRLPSFHCGRQDSTRTDSAGIFVLPSQRSVHWFHLDRGLAGTLTIAHPDFTTATTNYGGVGMFERLEKSAPGISLGDIILPQIDKPHH